MSDAQVVTAPKGVGPKKDDASKIGAGRGPAYPSIPLREAVRRIMQLKDANVARVPLAPDTIFKIWGFNGPSGASRPILASVGYYDLMEPIGRGDDRRLKLSDLALKIVFDKVPDSPDRASALKEAALKPSIHARLMDEFGIPLPADIVLERYLVRDRRFNESAAATVLKVYRDTLEYAGLDNPDNLPGDEGLEGSDLSEPPDLGSEQRPAKVGEFVQWTSGGVDQFAAPQCVIGLSDDGQWLWVEGSKTGIPMTEVQVVNAPPTHGLKTPPPPPRGLFEDKSLDVSDADENVWKIIHDGDRLRMTASVDLKGLKKLLKRLHGYENILAVDDDDDGDD